MLEKALALAALGFHVFPLAEGTKTPLIDGWQRKATRDPQRIRHWWVCPVLGWEQPLNIGICTTRFGDDKALVVIDVDVKNGKPGEASLRQLEQAGRVCPPTWESVTPTGGRHLIYVTDAPVKGGADVLGPGLDIRSWGGFIVAPGSVTEKGEYRWRDR